MARLAIGIVGAAIGGWFGGPVGASIGWTIGSFIGGMLFPTPGPVIEGPRLNDLKVVTSAFGEPIADNWGTMRIAGHLVDSQDIKEHRVEQEVEGGKGMGGASGTQVTYFYTVDAQFLICRAPADGIRRIWADTKLIRDVSADATLEELFASESKVKGGRFVFYLGAENQLPNPVMEALHGVGEVPAYRGVVTAVTDNFKLTDFGNRIPNFQFEVFRNGQSQFALLGTFPPILAGNLRASWSHVDDNGEIVCLNRDAGQPFDAYEDDAFWAARFTFAGIIREEKLLDPDPTQTGFAPVGGHADRPMYFTTRADNPSVTLFDYLNGLVYHLARPPAFASMIADRIVVEDDDVYMIINNYPFELAPPFGELVHFQFPNTFVKSTSALTTWLTDDLDGIGTQYLYALSITGGNHFIKKFDKASFALVGSLDTGLNSVMNISVVSDDEIYFVSQAGAGQNSKFWRVDNFSTITQIGEAPATPMFLSNDHTLIYKNGLFFWGVTGNIGGGEIDIYVYGGGLAVAGIPLSIVVSEICQMVGLKTSQIDVAELLDIVDGYARGRPMTPRDLIAQLQMRFFFDTVESDGKLKFRKRGRSPVLTIPKSELGAHEVGSDVPQSVTTTQVQERELPARLEVNYLQRDKSYEQGNQYDERLITQSRNIVTVPLALSMSDNAAKQTAVVLLTESWLTRNQREISLTRKYIELEPADVVTLQVD
jgi:hypothetical protein